MHARTGTYMYAQNQLNTNVRACTGFSYKLTSRRANRRYSTETLHMNVDTWRAELFCFMPFGCFARSNLVLTNASTPNKVHSALDMPLDSFQPSAWAKRPPPWLNQQSGPFLSANHKEILWKIRQSIRLKFEKKIRPRHAKTDFQHLKVELSQSLA